MLIQWLKMSELIKTIISLFVVIQLVSCSSGGDNPGATISITSLDVIWTAPVEREDGSTLSLAEIDGYRIYYGTVTGDYTNKVDINDGSASQAKITDIPSGTYYIVATTIDTDGRESQFSQEVTVTI